MSSEFSHRVVRGALVAGVLAASTFLGSASAHADTATGALACPIGQTLQNGVCQDTDLGWQ